MKLRIIILFMAVLAISCTDDDKGFTEGGEPNSGEEVGLPDVSMVTGFDNTSAPAGWELEWEENFDNDLSNWTIWNGGAFNNELQLYQADNLTVEDGYLYITSKRESSTGPTTPFDSTSKNFAFTSGRIESNVTFGPSSFATNKVRISARMKLGDGDGLWPAFWTYNDPWPTMGEIDIMEHRGNLPSEYITNFFYGETSGIAQTDSSVLTQTVLSTTPLTDNWHVFEVVWSATTFEMYFDGSLVSTYDATSSQYVDDLAASQHRLILNMAVGGDFFNGTNLVTANIPNNATTVVDWVRVYKEN